MNNENGIFTIKKLSETGIVFSVYLVIKDVLSGDYCPEIFRIPACYIVLFAFFLVRISLTKINSSKLFYAGSLTGLTLAIFFSYSQIAGKEKCPVLLNVPLCYGSLFLFTAMIVLYNTVGKQ